MSFQFGFVQPEADDSNEFFLKENNTNKNFERNEENETKILKLPFKLIDPTIDNLWNDSIDDIEPLELQCFAFSEDRSLYCVQPDFDYDDNLSIVNSHSDLVPGIYEGGAKIWECTLDLAKYLLKEPDYILNTLENKNVLDLGCGAGILGILALQAGSTVYFQDYNEEVLKNITLKNVQLNVQQKDTRTKDCCIFISGDWEKYAETNIESHQFDVILTSETIYNPTNYRSLLNIFKTKLKPNGIVLLAAKTYYFGVGGGLRDFENFLRTDESFHSEVVWTHTENVSREILKLKKIVK